MSVGLEILFYEKKNKKPVKDFVSKLEEKDKRKIFKCFDSIEKYGLNPSGFECRQIKGKLWEIKIRTFSGGIRIFYIILEFRKIILLHAYKKKSQKAPQKEIEKALMRMKEVLNQINKGD